MNAQNIHISSDIRLPFQLLVEGNDDRNFFEALSNDMGIGRNVQFQNFEGRDRLSKFLAGFILEPKFRNVKRIGIIRDADENARGAFNSVCSSLKNTNLPVPAECGVFAQEFPSVGILVLPSANQNGMLETLLCRIIADFPEYACIDEFMKCVEELRGCGIVREDKARAHAFIATQSDPHVSVGVAAKKGFWNLEHREFAPMRQFLMDLVDHSNVR